MVVVVFAAFMSGLIEVAELEKEEEDDGWKQTTPAALPRIRLKTKTQPPDQMRNFPPK